MFESKGIFSELFRCPFNFYFKKTVSHTAKLTIIAIKATGSTFILSPKSTINGPAIAPISPNAYVNPTAVDWISTVNASVCMDAINVYAVAEYFYKFTWEYPGNSHQSCPHNQIVLDWIEEKQQSNNYYQSIKSSNALSPRNPVHIHSWMITKWYLRTKRPSIHNTRNNTVIS